MTYRSRYLTTPMLPPVIDLLLLDETNPRSVAFQVAALVDHVDQLPRDADEDVRTPEQRLVLSLLTEVRLAEVAQLCDEDSEGRRGALEALLGRGRRRPAASLRADHPRLLQPRRGPSAAPTCDDARNRPVLYEVSHRTTYRYSIPVSFSHHLMHLSPRPCAASDLPSHGADRRCRRRRTHAQAIDYFGNPVSYITLQHQHKELILHARSVIEVMPRRAPIRGGAPPWDQIYPRLFHDTSDEGAGGAAVRLRDAEDAGQRRRSAPTPRDCFPPGRPMLEGVLELTRRIHQDFRYDPTATTVSTPVEEVFEARRGVCQDFAHLQLACLRALRLPARYVSGYLLTRPAEGKEKLVGADASHAWLSVWCPATAGSMSIRPTTCSSRSSTSPLAWGRDYGDVSPVSGAIFGGGAHTVQVAVDVTPIVGAG